MLENLDIPALVNTYVVPYAINIVMAVAIYYVGKIVVGIVIGVVGKLLNRAEMEPMLVTFVSNLLRWILLLFVIIAALGQLGIETTSLVALLGAAGLAIGLSLQGSLQNFASGVMLMVFRPFKSGDFVEAAGTSGIIEAIGIFTTTMRTGDNKEVIIPNGGIYGGNIINYSARDTRRVDMVFGCSYDADVREVKALLEKILSEDDRILADPAYTVAVGELADSSVNFITRPWVNSADYWAVLWDTTERVKIEFDAANIGIPFPQMDVHIEKDD
ncbi:mechanosensitive ion channel [Halieaceae bacterium IMCC14734]|uniref:Small-conductance mechanosensitive channel n=1 Tax=Candidatus Litorirhabdus singularis TaxID=2518993 RepID=A0ABT3TAC7_9GAMM|nr:mechanosensitive ion channel domain-containing protein [Candidatus Litorirhabdus singularis]MCX2979253.1 mechanosensitive ion channel [Candidatus Litorirhabdus singularis]